MTTTNLPASDADQPMDETASRRLMISLYGEKAESLGTLLLRSTQVEPAKSEAKPRLDAQFDASQFDAFMSAVNRRANALQDHDAVHSAGALRSNWRAWALAAAALLVIIIGSSFLYRAHLDSSNVAVAPASSFDLAGESKPAPPPVAPASPQQ